MNKGFNSSLPNDSPSRRRPSSTNRLSTGASHAASTTAMATPVRSKSPAVSRNATSAGRARSTRFQPADQIDTIINSILSSASATASSSPPKRPATTGSENLQKLLLSGSDKSLPIPTTPPRSRPTAELSSRHSMGRPPGASQSPTRRRASGATDTGPNSLREIFRMHPTAFQTNRSLPTTSRGVDLHHPEHKDTASVSSSASFVSFAASDTSAQPQPPPPPPNQITFTRPIPTIQIDLKKPLVMNIQSLSLPSPTAATQPEPNQNQSIPPPPGVGGHHISNNVLSATTSAASSPLREEPPAAAFDLEFLEKLPIHSPHNRVCVCVRLRPPMGTEFHPNALHLNPLEGTVSLLKTAPEKIFKFDHVFGPNASQGVVYRVAAASLVNDVLQGMSCCVIAYGITGAGKTFSLSEINIAPSGALADSCGILPRALQELFERVESDKGRFEYSIKISYMQIYMETIQDLLYPESGSLQIREDTTGQVFVSGLSEHKVKSLREVLALIETGSRAKYIAQTKMNRQSSRSHTIFTVHVERREAGIRTKICGERRVQKGKLTVVDLAGSERTAKTQPEGTLFEEAKSINLSLSMLGNVVAALADPSATFVPWRDSKLTRILQDSLGGTARTCLLVNLTPDDSHIQETTNSLLFGQRAMNIFVSPIVNEEIDYKALAGELQDNLNQSYEKQQQVESEAATRLRTMEQESSAMKKEMEKMKTALAEAQRQIHGAVDAYRSLASEHNMLRFTLAQEQERSSALESMIFAMPEGGGATGLPLQATATTTMTPSRVRPLSANSRSGGGQQADKAEQQYQMEVLRQQAKTEGGLLSPSTARKNEQQPDSQDQSDEEFTPHTPDMTRSAKKPPLLPLAITDQQPSTPKNSAAAQSNSDLLFSPSAGSVRDIILSPSESEKEFLKRENEIVGNSDPIPTPLPPALSAADHANCTKCSLMELLLIQHMDEVDALKKQISESLHKDKNGGKLSASGAQVTASVSPAKPDSEEREVQTITPNQVEENFVLNESSTQTEVVPKSTISTSPVRVEDSFATQNQEICQPIKIVKTSTVMAPPPPTQSSLDQNQNTPLVEMNNEPQIVRKLQENFDSPRQPDKALVEKNTTLLSSRSLVRVQSDELVATSSSESGGSQLEDGGEQSVLIVEEECEEEISGGQEEQQQETATVSASLDMSTLLPPLQLLGQSLAQSGILSTTDFPVLSPLVDTQLGIENPQAVFGAIFGMIPCLCIYLARLDLGLQSVCEAAVGREPTQTYEQRWLSVLGHAQEVLMQCGSTQAEEEGSPITTDLITALMTPLDVNMSLNTEDQTPSSARLVPLPVLREHIYDLARQLPSTERDSPTTIQSLMDALNSARAELQTQSALNARLLAELKQVQSEHSDLKTEHFGGCSGQMASLQSENNYLRNRCDQYVAKFEQVQSERDRLTILQRQLESNTKFLESQLMEAQRKYAALFGGGVAAVPHTSVLDTEMGQQLIRESLAKDKEKQSSADQSEPTPQPQLSPKQEQTLPLVEPIQTTTDQSSNQEDHAPSTTQEVIEPIVAQISTELLLTENGQKYAEEKEPSKVGIEPREQNEPAPTATTPPTTTTDNLSPEKEGKEDQPEISVETSTASEPLPPHTSAPEIEIPTLPDADEQTNPQDIKKPENDAKSSDQQPPPQSPMSVSKDSSAYATPTATPDHTQHDDASFLSTDEVIVFDQEGLFSPPHPASKSRSALAASENQQTEKEREKVDEAQKPAILPETAPQTSNSEFTKENGATQSPAGGSEPQQSNSDDTILPPPETVNNTEIEKPSLAPMQQTESAPLVTEIPTVEQGQAEMKAEPQRENEEKETTPTRPRSPELSPDTSDDVASQSKSQKLQQRISMLSNRLSSAAEVARAQRVYPYRGGLEEEFSQPEPPKLAREPSENGAGMTKAQMLEQLEQEQRMMREKYESNSRAVAQKLENAEF